MLISYCNIQSQIMKLELPSNGGIIGYDGANFIVLDETGVSSLHMRLSYIDDKLFAEDLQSLNGTYLNRNLLTEKTEIKTGEQKKPVRADVTLSGDKLRKYFPKSYSPMQMEAVIFKLLDAWQRKRQRDQSR